MRAKSNPILTSHYARDMTFARRVFDKCDVPRTVGDLFPFGNFDLSLAAKCEVVDNDHVLATRGAMPIVYTTSLPYMEFARSDRQ